MRVIFFGSSNFASPTLEALHADAAFDVVMVVTETAKRAGRGGGSVPTPVRKKAEELGLLVYEPDTLRDTEAQKRIASLNAEVGVLAAYGKIIPPEVLTAPKHGIVNIHPSLLPALRGPSPIQTALLEGEQKTGVTLIVLDEEVDHGPIISQESVDISSDDIYATLSPRLAEHGARMVCRDIPGYIAGTRTPEPQNHEAATFTAMLKKEDGHIDWTRSAEEIYNRWRAFVVWPTSYSFASRGESPLRLIFTEMRPAERDTTSHTPGTIVAEDDKIFVQCGSGAVEIRAVQPEGKRAQDARAFINGYRDILGTVLE